MSDVHKGGCLCGAVRYTTTGAPMSVSVCHCTFCQRRTGSAFSIPVYFPDEQIEFNEGKRSIYQHISDESGRWLRVEFCPVCGTTVAWSSERRPGAHGISGGTFDDPNWIEVQRHVWTRSKQKLASIPPGVEQYETAKT